MSRYLRSGVFSFWLAVVAAMTALALVAFTFGDRTETPAQPHTEDLFDAAVNLRSQIAVAFRSGDTTALEAHIDTLRKRWTADAATDPAQRAATDSLTRLDALVANAERLDSATRDAIVSEADLFSALAAAPTDPAVIAAVEAGVDGEGRYSETPVAETPDSTETPDAAARLAASLARLGIDRTELRAQFSAAGAPELPYTPATPTLDPPGKEDLPR